MVIRVSEIPEADALVTVKFKVVILNPAVLFVQVWTAPDPANDGSVVIE